MNVSLAEASVIFNEIFADPATGLTGDANNDGTRSWTQDEFIELLNTGESEANISNWYLTNSVSTRHIFPSNTVISPYTFLVVFGGGDPELSGIHWQVASSGSLGLNNSSDIVTLFDADGNIINRVNYGSIANNDQSITLFPDGESSEFFLHSGLEQSRGALFSPGTSVDSKLILDVTSKEEMPDNPVVPELPTLVYLMSAWVPLLLKRA